MTGDEKCRKALEEWIEGWSLCIAVVNYQRTGYRSDGLLDVQYVTDEDVAQGVASTARPRSISTPSQASKGRMKM